jgi:hypothetical protein
MLTFAYAKELTIFFESKKYPGSGSENNLREYIPGHPVVARQFSI